MYSGRLHLVSDLLQTLFKEAYSLQKQLMELLDKVGLGPAVDENNILIMVEGEQRISDYNRMQNGYISLIN